MNAIERQPVELFGPIGAGEGEPGLIAMPCRPWIWSAAIPPLLRLLTAAPRGSRFLFQPQATTIAAARNEAAGELLSDSELRWLLFLDSDQTPPADALARLLAWNVPIVGATIVKRTPPYDLAAGWWRQSENLEDFTSRYVELAADSPPLLQVDWVGTGCLLIRRAVLEAAWVRARPWFVANADDTTEDLRFCRRAAQAGFSAYLDTTLRVGHLALQSIVAARE